MHTEISTFKSDTNYRPYTDHTGSHHVALDLESFVHHLKKSGKVCPKPWCWRRFYILFNPGYEPPWLSSWWVLSTQDKHDLFLKQLEYLAYQTNRFSEAYRFLRGMEPAQWLVETD